MDTYQPDYAPHEQQDPVSVNDADGAVQHAVARTAEIAELPIAEHVERFEAAHTALSDALGFIDKV